MRRNNTRNQAGFTIIELAIASLVFSTVLLLITFGLIRVGRAFTKSVNASKTQEVARTIIEDITHAIQFSGDDVVSGNVPGPNGEGRFCIGNRKYSYALDKRVVEDNYGFVVDTGSSCNDTAPAALDLEDSSPLGDVAQQNATAFMTTGMSLDQFSIVQATQPGFWEVRVRVVYGEDGVDLEDPDGDGLRTCIAASGGSEYCAVTDLTTTVQKRIE